MSLQSLLQILTSYGSQVGRQAAVSLAVTAVTAAILSLPPALFADEGHGKNERLAEVQADPQPQSPAGKLLARYQRFDQGEGATPMAATRTLVTPAAIAMPLALDWTGPADEQSQMARLIAASARAQAETATLRKVEPDRVARIAPERARAVVTASLAPPLQLAAYRQPEPAGVAMTTASGKSVDEGSTVLGVPVPGVVTRAGRVVYGAASVIEGAGAWTVATAANLLPRWSN